MANAKSFDDSEVLKTALRVFIQKGYSGTSMRNIEKATRLSTGSMYFTFKNKRELFLKVMDYYIDNVVIGRIDEYIDRTDFFSGVRAYFESTFTNRSYNKCGCLLTITSAQSGMDELIMRKVESGFEIIQNKFIEIVKTAQERGEIDATKDPLLIAQHLFTSYQGLLVLVRFCKSDTYLWKATDAALVYLHPDTIHLT
ncbi:MAG: TetR/AcrR family transcriptional regulator [Nitrospirae bacterium]|nr:TetR/AcrR family transcriptional regulator [Nitrospirota bacterium]